MTRIFFFFFMSLTMKIFIFLETNFTLRKDLTNRDYQWQSNVDVKLEVRHYVRTFIWGNSHPLSFQTQEISERDIDKKRTNAPEYGIRLFFCFPVSVLLTDNRHLFICWDLYRRNKINVVTSQFRRLNHSFTLSIRHYKL